MTSLFLVRAVVRRYTARCLSEQASSRFVDRPNETLERKRARLVYQSRKRGMLENDLLLSTFAGEHIGKMNNEQLRLYDILINKAADNEWDLYYWMIEERPVPKEYDNEIMALLQEHARNTKKQQRIQQPCCLVN